MKIFGIAGYSGSGKTTLVEKLVPLFVANGIKISIIKHAHHNFDIDLPGKDSYRHRQAGASEILISSSRRWALMHELRGEAELSLAQLVKRVSFCDLLLIEGFKGESIPKLEVYRKVLGEPLLFPEDKNVVAIATDTSIESSIPVLPLNHPAVVAKFIFEYSGFTKRERRANA